MCWLLLVGISLLSVGGSLSSPAVVNWYHSRTQLVPSVTLTYHVYVVPVVRFPLMSVFMLSPVVLSLALLLPIVLSIVQSSLSLVS